MDFQDLPLFAQNPTDKQPSKPAPSQDATGPAKRQAQRFKVPSASGAQMGDTDSSDASDSDESGLPAASPPKHWTVSELTSLVRGVVEPAFQDVWVQGEVSNY